MNWKAQFTAWLKSKNWTAHSLAIIGLTAAGLITGDPQVRNFILEVFKAHPTLGADIVILAGIVAKYSHSSSAAGKVAVAEEILASANPPSLAAVAAATVKPPPNLSSKIPPAAILALLAVFLALPSLTACKGPTATAPLAPGYYTSAEQNVGEIIAAAKAAATTYEGQKATAGFVPVPGEDQTMSAIQRALVIADPLAIAWHASLSVSTTAVEPAALVTAVKTINSGLAALPGSVK